MKQIDAIATDYIFVQMSTYERDHALIGASNGIADKRLMIL